MRASRWLKGIYSTIVYMYASNSHLCILDTMQLPTDSFHTSTSVFYAFLALGHPDVSEKSIHALFSSDTVTTPTARRIKL
jgi:hypothetical protein